LQTYQGRRSDAEKAVDGHGMVNEMFQARGLAVFTAINRSA